ncbi:polcalcin Syr v 3-like [Solanum dulcamara]|uniref:polcalcin Syr v 3-like n=1 Tax=Solanum dulcamara TaxID=45834 RepID=UPI0024855EC9|nr:polcalcin Syr v 3-like [Solanum dulcamara]
MALKNNSRRNISSDGKLELSLQEFKKWLKRFDLNKDGKISKEELREAVMKNGGGWFSKIKGSYGMRIADSNGDGFIDEKEFKNLVEFAQRNLGVRII